MQNPKSLLKELIENNLSNNGYLVIEVPLFDSLQSQLSGKHWMHLDPPLHISHFTKKSLYKLLHNLNLKPIKYRYHSIHLGILGMVQSILSLFGYKRNLIDQLKFNRRIPLSILIILVLPFAFIIELLAVLCNRGGIIRVFCKKAD